MTETTTVPKKPATKKSATKTATPAKTTPASTSPATAAEDAGGLRIGGTGRIAGAELERLRRQVADLEAQLTRETGANAALTAAASSSGTAPSTSSDDAGAPRYSGVRRTDLCDFTATDPLTGEVTTGVGLVVDHDDDGVTVARLDVIGGKVPHDDVKHRR